MSDFSHCLLMPFIGEFRICSFVFAIRLYLQSANGISLPFSLFLIEPFLLNHRPTAFVWHLRVQRLPHCASLELTPEFTFTSSTECSKQHRESQGVSAIVLWL